MMRIYISRWISLISLFCIGSGVFADDEIDVSADTRATHRHEHHHGDGSASSAVCTEAGCHGLDPSITVDPKHAGQVLAALTLVDPHLAGAVKQSAPCEHCGLGPGLDQQSLLVVSINPESRVKVDQGPVPLQLKANTWNTFLVRVQNLAGSTAPLRAFSDQFLISDESPTRRRWLEFEFVETEGLGRELSGAILEYRVVRLRTSDVGKRAAVLAMDIGQGTSDIGFRNDIMLTFQCQE